MVLRKPRAHILKPGINVRLLHRIHQNLNRLGLGARKIMREILLQPPQIRCRIRLLFRALLDLSRVCRIKPLGRKPEHALKTFLERINNTRLLACGFFQAVHKGPSLKPLVGIIGPRNRITHFIEGLALTLNRSIKILRSLVRRVGTLARFGQFLFHTRNVALGKFAHRTLRLGQLAQRLLVDLTIARGILHQLLHPHRKLIRTTARLGLLARLHLKPTTVFLIRQLGGIQLAKPLVFIEQSGFAPREIFEIADLTIELTLEQLRVFITRQDMQNQRLGIRTYATREKIFGVRAQHNLLRANAECCRRKRHALKQTLNPRRTSRQLHLTLGRLARTRPRQLTHPLDARHPHTEIILRQQFKIHTLLRQHHLLPLDPLHITQSRCILNAINPQAISTRSLKPVLVDP